MSVFLVPPIDYNQPKVAKQFKAVYALGFLRQIGLIAAIVGLLGSLAQSFMLWFLDQTALSLPAIKAAKGLLEQLPLPIWLSICLGGLLAAIFASITASKTATDGGLTIIAAMRDDLSEKCLLPLLNQMTDAYVLFHPTLRLESGEISFDLAAVSPHGITFIRTRPPANEGAGIAKVKAACQSLGEQHSLPLLGKVRFIQLWEPSEAGWEACNQRDLNRKFQRLEADVGHAEIAKSFRLLYNLTLPSHKPAVPVEGRLPVSRDSRPIATTSRVVHLGRGIGSIVRSFIKAALVVAMALAIISAGLWALQYLDYEVAEKFTAPVRVVLRKILPREWQQQLALGEEILVNEDHFAATVGRSLKLAVGVGQAGAGKSLDPGTRVRLIQTANEGEKIWYMIRENDGDAIGWVPRESLRFLHVVPKGTPLYKRGPLFARSDPAAEPQKYAEREYPVALLQVRRVTAADGQIITWSKVMLMDRTIAYVRGEL